MAHTDLLNEAQSITMKVWLPGTHPGSHQAAMTLESLAGLHYFLSTLTYGNYLVLESSLRWLPGSHKEALTLENLLGLRYFLTDLAYGNLTNQLFEMVAYTGQWQRGKGIYIVHKTEDPLEPMKLDLTHEEGEIEDVVREVWKQVMHETYIGT